MAIIKEWKCLQHGPFTGAQGVCEWGCTTVIREFRSAPGTRSARTKASDTALNRMAARYGLGDISAKSGSVAGDRIAKQQGFGNIGGQDFTPRWGEIPKGGTFEPGKGPVDREGSEGGASAIVKSISQGRAEQVPDTAGALPIDIPKRRAIQNVVGRDSITANEFSDAIRRAE